MATTAWTLALVPVLALVAAAYSASLGGSPQDVPDAPRTPLCHPEKLTVYKVVLHTFWTRDRFPKHYPDWRPPAQWSKVIGRSHDASYTLFRLGRAATPGVRAMAETGRSDVLEEQSQGEGGVYDEFSAPPIHTGAGRTEAEFFVDGNHSRVSLMSRIVPSPDWFIGIDSFDLCVDGSWLDSITIEVDPIDAGTDNGFTFTAPNWPTEPQGVVYRITSTYPQHPAGSFYYPFLKRLPPIGTFQFIKVKEYELAEVFHHSEDERHFDVFRSEHPNSIPVLPASDLQRDVQQEMEEQRLEEERRMLESKATESPAVTLWPALNKTSTWGLVRGATLIPAGDKDAVVNSILHTYSGTRPSATAAPDTAVTEPRAQRRKSHKTVRKIRAPRDCQVGSWGPWSECSKSCGIGEMQRRREVVKHPRRRGRPCPPLLETKWCGSARACAKGYFKW